MLGRQLLVDRVLINGWKPAAAAGSADRLQGTAFHDERGRPSPHVSSQTLPASRPTRGHPAARLGRSGPHRSPTSWPSTFDHLRGVRRSSSHASASRRPPHRGRTAGPAGGLTSSRSAGPEVGLGPGAVAARCGPVVALSPVASRRRWPRPPGPGADWPVYGPRSPPGVTIERGDDNAATTPRRRSSRRPRPGHRHAHQALSPRPWKASVQPDPSRRVRLQDSLHLQRPALQALVPGSIPTMGQTHTAIGGLTPCSAPSTTLRESQLGVGEHCGILVCRRSSRSWRRVVLL